MLEYAQVFHDPILAASVRKCLPYPFSHIYLADLVFDRYILDVFRLSCCLCLQIFHLRSRLDWCFRDAGPSLIFSPEVAFMLL